MVNSKYTFKVNIDYKYKISGMGNMMMSKQFIQTI